MGRKKKQLRVKTVGKNIQPCLDFSELSDDIRYHHIARYLTYPTLAAFAMTNKASFQQLLPELINRLPKLKVNVATGGSNSFIFSNTNLYACGYNSSGQLGLGDSLYRQQFNNGLQFHISHFTRVKDLTGFVQQVIVRGSSTFVLTDKGLYACGWNDSGQLGLGDNQDRHDLTEIMDIPGTLQQIVLGSSSTFVLTDAGLYACGSNVSGKLGLGNDQKNYNNLTKIINVTGIVQQIAAGAGFTFILTDRGLYSCGDNIYGQLGFNDNQSKHVLTQVTDITGAVQRVITGFRHVFVLTSTGLYACGENSTGQLGLGDNQHRRRFTKISGIIGNVRQVAAGGAHTFVLTDSGLYACGNNEYGQLGLGHKLTKYSFTSVDDIPGTVQQIIAEGDSTFILTDKGLYGCGNNEYGQLGLGDKRHRNRLTLITSLPDVIKRQGKYYQNCQHLIALQQHSLFRPTTTQSLSPQEAIASEISHSQEMKP